MDAMIALLKAEKERLEKAVEDFEAREKTEQTQRERMVRRIAAMRAVLLKIAGSATQAGRSILAEYDKLPAPLREQLKTGAQLVRTRLDEKASAESAVERLRTVVAFGHDMQRILSEVHAVKEVVAFEDGARLEVDVIYLGGVVGFYLTPDGRRSGLLRRSGDRWTREARDEIAPQVVLALEVARKETPPTLVPLPLDPPRAKEEKSDE
jgi:hypothetical protein